MTIEILINLKSSPKKKKKEITNKMNTNKKKFLPFLFLTTIYLVQILKAGVIMQLIDQIKDNEFILESM